MDSITRRSFAAQAIAGFSALTTLSFPADAQRVYTTSDWKMASFEKFLTLQAQMKQMFDVVNIEDGGFLLHIANSLNGLHFGFGIPLEQILTICVLRETANLLSFNDYAWKKYRLGEMMAVNDPKTGKSATRNFYYPSDAGNPPKYASSDPNDEESMFQDTSIQALQARGVQFLSCHAATEGLARYIVQKQKLSKRPEEVVQDLQSHVYPGVIIVPSGVSAIAMLQSRGHFSYLGG